MKIKRNVQKVAELGIVATVIAALFAGCGGGGSGSSGAAPTSLSGVVADGYLSNVKVCLDVNGNGVCDASEPSATTDANGAYTISGITAGQESLYPLIAEVPAASVDKDTGVAVGQAFTLAAPAGSTFVSPLSTLVKDKVDAGATSASAVASVTQALGFTAASAAASAVSVASNYVSGKGVATDQNDFYFRAHEAAKVVAEVLKRGKVLVGSNTASTDKQTLSVLLGQAEATLQFQATSNAAATATMFSQAAVNASSVSGAGTLKANIAAKKANAANATQAVTINFDVVNGATNIGTTGCNASALTLGTSAAVGSLSDLRFYVSNVSLIDAAGNYVPVVMTQNANQDPNVALLDFENGANTCAAGNAALYTAIQGNVAPGTYVGVAFDVGVPENLNHTSVTAATTPALLQNLSMNWSWQSGRKFTKIEFANNPVMLNATTDAVGYAANATVITLATAGTGKVVVGDKVKFAGDATTYTVSAVLFAGANPAAGDTITLSGTGLVNPIPAATTGVTVMPRVTMAHLGATGCKANPLNGDVINGCGSPNRMHVEFATFNTGTNKVALDLGALFGGLDMTALNNTWMSAKPGAMMMAATASYFFNKLQIDAVTGLPINDGAAQTVFVKQ